MIKTMMRFMKILVLGLLVLAGYILYIFISTGFFRTIDNSGSHNSLKTFHLPGVEDMAISRKDSFLLLSSDDRAARRNDQAKQGGIYLLDLTTENARAQLISGNFPFTFYPHGISLHQKNDSTYRLWVINHPAKGTHKIEVFDLHGDSLVHVQSLMDERLISPNDLIAIDESKFYVTNDHGYTSKLGLLAENYLGLRASNVLHYDGKTFKEVAGDIAYANGIAFDKHRKKVFVASPRNFEIKVYDQLKDGGLNFIEDIYVNSGIDNLMLDPHGNIWTAGHPNLLRFTSYAAGKSETSPSEVFKIEYKSKGKWKIEQIFLDNGEKVSGSSVAVPFGSEIYIGDVMDDVFISIDIK